VRERWSVRSEESWRRSSGAWPTRALRSGRLPASGGGLQAGRPWAHSRRQPWRRRRAGSAQDDQEFEEASIRRCDPGNLPDAPAVRAAAERNSMQMTPGRLNALCATLATLIRVSYGYTPDGDGLQQ
jgi:hypothetical protein